MIQHALVGEYFRLVQQSNPLFYYPMGERRGSTVAVDQSGHHRHGTIFSTLGTRIGRGPLGPFTLRESTYHVGDSNADSIQVPDDGSLTETIRSWAFWISRLDTGTGSVNLYQKNSGTGSGRQVQWIGTTDVLRLRSINANVQKYALDSPPVRRRRGLFCVVTWAGIHDVGTGKWYINGVRVPGTESAVVEAVTSGGAVNAVIWIQPTASARSRMHHVACWGYELDGSQIAEMWAAGSGERKLLIWVPGVAADPAINLSVSDLTPTCQQGEDADPDTFDVTNSGGGTLDYTVSDDADWLSVSPGSGTSTGESDEITVTYDTDGLFPGIYEATITVTDVDATNNPQTIAVTLTVTEGPVIDVTILPRIAVSGGDLDDGALAPFCLEGENAAGQTFDVFNSGVETLRFSISDNVAWLSLSPTTGNSTGGTVTINATYNTSGLAAGTYNATITITSTDASNSPFTVSVNLTVYEINPLTVTPVELENIIGEGRDASDQTLVLSNRSNSPVNWSVASDEAWCIPATTVGSLTSGTLDPGETVELTVEYDSDALAAGVHTATITFNGDSGETPTDVPVELTVLADPRIGTSLPSNPTLSRTIAPGQSLIDNQFGIYNIGGGTLDYEVASDQAWLAVDPDSGLSTGETDQITVSYDVSGLSAGTHNATITITDAAADNSPVEIEVTIVVEEPEPPSNETTMNVSVVRGQNTTRQITLAPASPGYDYEAESDELWLTVDPSTGSVAGISVPVDLEFDSDELDIGVYTADVVFTTTPAGPNSPFTIHVILTVRSGWVDRGIPRGINRGMNSGAI